MGGDQKTGALRRCSWRAQGGCGLGKGSRSNGPVGRQASAARGKLAVLEHWPVGGGRCLQRWELRRAGMPLQPLQASGSRNLQVGGQYWGQVSGVVTKRAAR